MNEFLPIEAERVSLVAIPSAVLAMPHGDASHELRAPTTLDRTQLVAEVLYPADFAGDASVMFAGLLARREAGREPAAILGAIVDRSLRIAVGNMGTHGMPVGGKIEIGYTVSPAYEGCGYATEMLRAFRARLLERDDVAVIVAETLAENAASIRVLEKCGFTRTGSRDDAEGGMILWETRGT